MRETQKLNQPCTQSEHEDTSGLQVLARNGPTPLPLCLSSTTEWALLEIHGLDKKRTFDQRMRPVPTQHPEEYSYLPTFTGNY